MSGREVENEVGRGVGQKVRAQEGGREGRQKAFGASGEIQD